MDDPIRSREAGVNLVAVMPSSAHVAWRVFPAPESGSGSGITNDVLVIARQWLFARGASLEAYCTVARATEQNAELVSLTPADGMLASAAFLEKAPVRTIQLFTTSGSGVGPQVDLQTLLVTHSSSHSDPAVVSIVVVAF
jgi:hypothetical protein